MSKAAIISRKAMINQLVDRLSYTTHAVDPLVHDEYADFAEEILLWSKLYSGLKNAYFERKSPGRVYSSVWCLIDDDYPYFSHIEIFREVIAAIKLRTSGETCDCRHVFSPRKKTYRCADNHLEIPF